jgi:hypothetical protein
MQSHRYYGVVNAWITQMRTTYKIIIEYQKTIGVKVLNPAEVLESTETRVKHKIRQTGKALKRYAWVDRDRLDATGQKRLDHQSLVALRLKQALTTAKNESAIDLAPIQSLPRPNVKMLKSA